MAGLLGRAPFVGAPEVTVTKARRAEGSRSEVVSVDYAHDSTPLWLYALREGFVLSESGAHLGPVGGRIVGEVFIGMLQLDRDSYLWQRGWRLTLPQRSGRVTGEFKMIDFLTFAGVAPDQRGQ